MSFKISFNFFSDGLVINKSRILFAVGVAASIVAVACKILDRINKNKVVGNENPVVTKGAETRTVEVSKHQIKEMFNTSESQIDSFFNNISGRLEKNIKKLDLVDENFKKIFINQKNKITALQKENVRNALIVGRIKRLTIADFPNHPPEDLNGKEILLIDGRTGLPSFFCSG